MKRILIGLIVAAMLAAGGWFGFNLYVQHRATSEGPGSVAPQDLVRLSIGLEDRDDLLQDLQQALA